jgi:hypothetical protein
MHKKLRVVLILGNAISYCAALHEPSIDKDSATSITSVSFNQTKAADGTENQIVEPSQGDGSPTKKARRTTRTVQQTLVFQPDVPVLPLGLVRVEYENAPLPENPKVTALQAGSMLGRNS